MGKHESGKIFVSEVPDPPVGVWREITQPQQFVSECMGWFYSLKATNMSDLRVDTVPYSVHGRGKADCFVLMARRRA